MERLVTGGVTYPEVAKSQCPLLGGQRPASDITLTDCNRC